MKVKLRVSIRNLEIDHFKKYLHLVKADKYN